MRAYIVRRLLLIPPMLFVISLFLFWLLNVLPGDAAIVSVGFQSGNCVECMENFEEQLGIDRPFFVQYFDWLAGAIRLDFGKSLVDQQEITPQIQERIWNTVEIGILTVILSTLIGVPVGIISAVRAGTGIDYFLRTFSVVGLSVPNFWLATLLITLPVIWWDITPLTLDYVSFTEDPVENLKIVFWPALVLAVSSSAYVARITRSSMLDSLYSDHVRTARAKGLRERVVIVRHVFRASLVTLLTVVGLQAGVILGGAIIAEQIFAIPGLGTLTLEGVQLQDYRVVLATTMIFALVFMLVTLMVDVLYAYVDPRIRY
jgi:peptide/nickel transport system permease protein